MLRKYQSVFLVFIFAFLMAMQASAQDPFQLDGAGIDAPAVVQMSDHGSVFVHTAGVNNITLHYTTMDHPLLNGNPDALIFIQQVHKSETENPHFTGVWYNPLSQRWAIFNQDLTAMPSGASYIVQVLSPSESVFQIQVPVNATTWPIYHPLLNGNPLAKVQITPNYNFNGPNGLEVGGYFDQPLAVGYWSDVDLFRIFSPGDSLPAGAAFNVQIIDASSRDISFIHTANSENTVSYYTYLDHPLLTASPNAQILVTPLYDHYDTEHNKLAFTPLSLDHGAGGWAIYYSNLSSAMLHGTQFLVTIVGTYNQIDNPVTNAGFEVGAVGATNLPHSWNAVGAVKRACNKLTKGKIMAYEQYCAAQVRGGQGATNSLSQNLANVAELDSGETAFIGARVMGKGVTSGARILAVIKMEDGNKLKTKVPTADLLGSYSYKPVMGSSKATLSANPTSIKVKILHSGAGSLLVDAIYMSDADLSGVLTVPQDGGASENLIPLPEAAP